MKTLYKLLILSLVLFSTTYNYAQIEIDTIQAYPDTVDFLDATIVVTINITATAIRYIPDNDWDAYTIEKLIIIVPNHPDSIRDTYFGVSVGETPYDSILYDTFLQVPTTYPEWHTIEIDTPITIYNETSFYIFGDIGFVIARTQEYNEEIRNHLIYDFQRNLWLESGPYYWAMKVVIKKTTSGIDDQNSIINSFKLDQNYPNPFNPVTKIKYTIPTPPVSSPLVKGRTKEGFVTLKVYDVLGNEVATLVNEYKPAGSYEVEFNAEELSSGIYFYKLQVANLVEIKKMILLK